MNVISFRCGLNVARSLLLTYCRCQFIASSTVGSGVALNSVASHKAGSAGQGAGLWDIHACMVLKFTSENILKDPYMTYAGQMVLQELGLAAFWTSVIVLFLAYLVYRFLHRLGERQAQDELIGGRNLTDDVKVVAALMRKRNDASTLYFDDLPLKKTVKSKILPCWVRQGPVRPMRLIS